MILNKKTLINGGLILVVVVVGVIVATALMNKSEQVKSLTQKKAA
jgi:hypothetical protein